MHGKTHLAGCGLLVHIVVWLAAIPFGCGVENAPATVQQVDLERYMGAWYEVARLPVGFQEGCVSTRAEYFLRSDGKVDVLNVCRKGAGGPIETAQGVARVVDPKTNAKLKVSFFWPFEGDYWVFRLDEQYRYAAVGSPDRKSLWILSREPTMPEDVYRQWVESLRKDGFAVERLIRTPTPWSPVP